VLEVAADAGEPVALVVGLILGGAELAGTEALVGAADDRVDVPGTALNPLRRGAVLRARGGQSGHRKQCGCCG
jgi:hypothetical protein